MQRIIDLNHDEAKKHFLKQSSYLKEDLPDYISFGPVLNNVAKILEGASDIYYGEKPFKWSGVNYELLTNKDGRFDWRPIEIMHPALYVSLVNLICEKDNWAFIQERAKKFENDVVECCSWPVCDASTNENDQAEQVRSWWRKVEQKSLTYSLDYTHIIHTDVVNCYGTLYTHSISWALHGFHESKAGDADGKLGDKIDRLIRAGRHGQTNGIPQGSQLMDLVAELVLGYVDLDIANEVGPPDDFKILRYRDDYRIFARSDARAEEVLKVVADKLRHVGMRLGAAKTQLGTNVVEASIKREKLTAINLQDLGVTEAKTIQKQLLRLHTFCRQHPHSGQLRRLLSDFHKKVAAIDEAPDDLAVQVAIATDIGSLSPSSFPAVAAILSHLISLSSSENEKEDLWNKVREKMRNVPKNGYLDIWLQRVIQPESVGLAFRSDEAICRIITGGDAVLWESDWITQEKLKTAIDIKQIVVGDIKGQPETVSPEEIALFSEQAEQY